MCDPKYREIAKNLCTTYNEWPCVSNCVSEKIERERERERNNRDPNNLITNTQTTENLTSKSCSWVSKSSGRERDKKEMIRGNGIVHGKPHNGVFIDLL